MRARVEKVDVLGWNKSSTFQKYAHNDARQRRNIGGRVGKPSVVSAYNVEFTVQHTIRADCH